MAWRAAEAAAVFVVCVGVALAILFGIAASAVMPGVVVFLVSLPVAFIVAARQRGRARRLCDTRCASCDASVAYLGWDGTVHGFLFVSTAYAVRFASANANALVNADRELRAALVAARPPPPARAIAIDAPSSRPPPFPEPRRDVVTEWIARIESYKGPVARRNALERALEEVVDPDERRKLLLAASRIEVGAVLEKVESLKTPASRRRHLEKAIAELRADDLPDELQAEELAMLEAALRASAGSARS